VLGFSVAAVRAQEMAQWIVASSGTTTSIVATSPLDEVTFWLKCGGYAGLVLAPSPLAVLLWRIRSHEVISAAAFGALSVAVSAASVLFYRAEFLGFTAAMSQMQPDFTSVITLESLALGIIFLPGPSIALLLAPILRWLLSNSAAQPPQLPGRA